MTRENQISFSNLVSKKTYFSINKREQKAPGLTVVLLKVWPGIQLQI